MKRRVLISIVLSVVLLGWGLIALGSGAADDGPYFVVDPLLEKNDETSHVYKSLEAVFKELDTLKQEAWGATLVLLPGEHTVTKSLVVNVPGLTIEARDETEKTQIAFSCLAKDAAALVISARNVSLNGIKVVGSGANGIGISVTANDCSLHDIIVESCPQGGISALGADHLILENVKVFSCVGTGASLSSSLKTEILGCVFVANSGDGLQLNRCDGAQIEQCEATRNGGNGFHIVGSRNVMVRTAVASSNNLSGILLNSSNWCSVEDSVFKATEGGPGIQLTDTRNVTIQRNTLLHNSGGGIKLISDAQSAIDNKIVENQIELQGGAPGAAPPSVPGISLVGNVVATLVKGNQVKNTAYGITLLPKLGCGGASPSANDILDNSLENSTQQGIRIDASGGGNRFEGNTVSITNQEGILVQAGQDDLFVGNQITDAGTHGMRIAKGVKDTVIRANHIQQCGLLGVKLEEANEIRLEYNTIEGCSQGGIADQETKTLVLTGNSIFGHEGYGIMLQGTEGCTARSNLVHDNNREGIKLEGCTNLTISPWNQIWQNRLGGIRVVAANAADGVITGNLIFGNLGYGVSLEMQVISVGSNWWGSVRGPSGLFAGQGNALLGIHANPEFASPLLSAPPATLIADELVTLADYSKAQVSFITTFASRKVVVNRLDTSHVRLTFTGVEDRASGWVNTVPVDVQALEASVDSTPPGTIITAASILVAGINGSGSVEAAMNYGPYGSNDTPSPNIKMYAYFGGNWYRTESGAYKLSGGAWEAIAGCTNGGFSLVVGEFQVAELLGEVKVVVLVTGEQGTVTGEQGT